MIFKNTIISLDAPFVLHYSRTGKEKKGKGISGGSKVKMTGNAYGGNQLKSVANRAEGQYPS